MAVVQGTVQAGLSQAWKPYSLQAATWEAHWTLPLL